jgi:hypothetical protein
MSTMCFKPINISQLVSPMGSVSSAPNIVYETKKLCGLRKIKTFVILSFIFETGIWMVSKVCHLCAKHKEKRHRNWSRAEVKA